MKNHIEKLYDISFVQMWISSIGFSIQHLKRLVSLLLLILFIWGCNPARRLPEGTYLLNKNKYVLEDKQNVNMYDIWYISTHVPNKRILDIYRFNLRTYVLFDTKKEYRFNNWMKKHFGEPPVILDTNLVNNSISQIKLYLFNNGYFNAEITKDIRIKHKRADVTYQIKANEPYRINEITQSISDSNIRALINSDSSQFLLNKGDIFESKNVAQERDRMAALLNKNGYFRFSKEFISFSIDTNLSKNALNIDIIIQDPIHKKESTNDTLIFDKHIQYQLRNVVINTNFNPLLPTESYTDTIFYKKDTLKNCSFQFIHNKDLHYLPRRMVSYLYFAPGEMYDLSKVNRSYTRLTELKNFSYVNITFEEVEDTLFRAKDSIQLIDCKIQLRPTNKYSFTSEAKGTNTGGNLGIGVEFTTTTRNIFKGGENLIYKLGASYEAQKLFVNSSKNILQFNTFEFLGNVKLDIPRFYFPVKRKYLEDTYRPKTVFNLGGNYQQRPDYNRFISSSYFGYEWFQHKTMKHSFNPLDINIVKINPTASFVDYLSNFNRRVREQYTDHLIVAMRYNFVYDNQSTKKGSNFMFFRFGVESVGNVLNAAMKIANAEKNASDQYTIGKIPYANYLLTDVDFRYYHQYTRKHIFAFRTAFGIGIPFTNSFSLPFEKSFYLGGANSMRGWRMRSLGPGSFYGDQAFESIGDIKIESNVEYRFPIWDYFRGAIFADAGNIWLVRENTTIPNGEFKTNEFYKELGVDAGIGLRLDFDYFLIRVDAGIPLINPTYLHYPELKPNFSISQTVLNFGIGYPF